MVYKKILVTSTGEYLDDILEHTLDLISERKMDVIGLYVIDTSVPFLTPKKIKEMMKLELEKQGIEILDSMKEEFEKPGNYMINFEGKMVEGDPADEIVRIAEEEGVDVIVMGTGKSIVDKHLLGSVSEKVVHSAPCSILLIRTAGKVVDRRKK